MLSLRETLKRLDPPTEQDLHDLGAADAEAAGRATPTAAQLRENSRPRRERTGRAEALRRALERTGRS